jgi:hypothetical protein
LCAKSGDTISFNSIPTTKLISWNNDTIVCISPDINASGNVRVSVLKRNSWRYDSENNPYWMPKESDIINYLKQDVESYGAYTKYKVITTKTSYNSNGEATGSSEFEYNDTRYLDDHNATEKSFTSDGQNFESRFKYNGTNVVISYKGKISSDGKTLESLTITRHDGENLVLRIGFKNLPLIKHGKYSTNFSWEFGAATNAEPYFSDFYMASYYPNGDKLIDYELKTGLNVVFSFSCRFIE